jgi:hypothetical protein
MTPAQWKQICDRVTQELLEFTRPFVTPLGTQTKIEVRMVGTGSYVMLEDRRILLTCEHVARDQPINFRFYGSDEVFEYRGP